MFYLSDKRLKGALARSGKRAQDVAAEVGLSSTAFSRALNGHRRVDRDLLDRIREAIDSRKEDQP
jgi:hypothetical protein